MGIYLYCILEARGVVTSMRETGYPEPTYLVAEDNVACLVSPYQGSPLAALTKEELVQQLLAHQRVVEQIMQNRAVLPVKFGTVLADPGEVRALLSQGQKALLSALDCVRDKVEIELAATWDLGQVIQEVSREQEVLSARDEASAQGLPSFEERLRLGQLVKTCLDRRRKHYQEIILSHLQSLPLDVVRRSLLSDQMVMNMAFLVEKAQQRELEERLRTLDQLFHGGITFRVIGPLPPYSFCTVDVTRVSACQLEEARQLLELGDELSEAEVRRAYRRVAAKLQGHLEIDPPAREQWAKARQAFALLQAYSQASADPHLQTSPLGDQSVLFIPALRRLADEDIGPDPG